MSELPGEAELTLTDVKNAGLRNFEGTTVSDTTISLTPDENGDNFKGLVNIPNHSIVNFEIVSICYIPCSVSS